MQVSDDGEQPRRRLVLTWVLNNPYQMDETCPSTMDLGLSDDLVDGGESEGDTTATTDDERGSEGRKDVVASSAWQKKVSQSSMAA